jgi:hypothetical protein
MSVPPESIEAGKCYFVRPYRSGRSGGIRRVVRIFSDGRIQFEHRTSVARPTGWKPGVQDLHSFAAMVEREVPCNWTPESEG